MRRRRTQLLFAPLALVVALVALLAGGSAAPGVSAPAPKSPYGLVHGCYAITTGSTAQPLAGGPFRLQAAALGRYLIYGTAHDYLTDSGGTLGLASAPGERTIWEVAGGSAGSFTIRNVASGFSLAAAFAPASGCADYPEAQVDANGPAFRGASPESEVSGTIDAHTHVTAFEFIGGDFHCGRPWDAFGVAFALPDCASIQGPQGTAAPVQNFLDYGLPVHPHDTRGWPTFKEWPGPTKLAEEGDYYTGIERAWKAGLRVMVTQLVDNEALCTVMPMKRNPCNDMDAVRLQAKDLRALQDYIDAQSGGPGKGWFRIVTNPFQARRVINAGKLAVVEGIEVSRIFGCGEMNGVSQCSRRQIDAGLSEVRRLGVQTFFPIHKFDNAFGGVKMDGGALGAVINAGNHLETGHFWHVVTCTGPEHDNTQIAPDASIYALLRGVFTGLLPSGALPTYPPPPHCNTEGLTDLGEYVIREMIRRHFIVELDHMSARAADDTLSILESKRYSGVISAHSWDSPQQNPRIYRLGGFVTPIAGTSASAFAGEWRADRRIRDHRFYFGTGFGYGADMNGLAEQGAPSASHAISYPFKSFDGRVTFTREQWGQRVFDLNKDGVANYGLYPDWLQELRVIAGRPILADMFHGAEAYLQMWERADGVPGPRCIAAHARFGAAGLGPISLGASAEQVLFRAGQPVHRPATGFRYCSARSTDGVGVAFSPGGRAALIASDAPGNRVAGIGAGMAARALAGRARALGSGVWLGTPLRNGARFVYGVARGRVAYVALASRAALTGGRRGLESYLRIAGS